jgi:hypothetical protein
MEVPYFQRPSGRSIAAPGPEGSGVMMVMVKCPDPCGHRFLHWMSWGGRTRTFGILVNSQAHCQLCYAPINEKSGINLIETQEKVKEKFSQRRKVIVFSRLIDPDSLQIP